MNGELIKKLFMLAGNWSVNLGKSALEAAALIEDQAAALEAANARIAELERKERSTARLLCRHGDGLCIDNAALESAAKAEPIYQERTVNGFWQDVSKELHDSISAGRVRSEGVRIVYTAPAALAQPLEAQAEALAAIKSAIADYHFALDMRAHGGVAQDRAFNAICNALGMRWKQGEETSRRALEALKETERDTRTIDMFAPEG